MIDEKVDSRVASSLRFRSTIVGVNKSKVATSKEQYHVRRPPPKSAAHFRAEPRIRFWRTVGDDEPRTGVAPRRSKSGKKRLTMVPVLHVKKMSERERNGCVMT